MIRSTRTIRLGMAFVLMLLGASVTGLADAATHQDPKALAVVEALEKAIAPENGWSKVGGLRFTYAVRKDGETVLEYHHTWNVASGQYRVDWKTQQGDQRIALFNVGAKGKQGQAYVRLTAEGGGDVIQSTTSGPPATGSKPRTIQTDWVRAPAPMERQILEAGYGRFIDDTYWLLMPLKLRDTGVNLDYDGEKRIGKQTYDVIRVSFEKVGLTPGDLYWLYVDRDSHLIDRCDFLPQPGHKPDWVKVREASVANPEPAAADKDAAEGGQRTSWYWKRWESFGPVKLATEKSLEDESVSIVLKSIEVLSSISESEFLPPARPVTHKEKPPAKPVKTDGTAKEKPNKG